jgi:hypothetical protein
MRWGQRVGRSADWQCSDCGVSLCSAHAERCDLCGQTFCQSCLSFHQSEHPKPAHADLQSARNKKSA